MRYIPHTDEEIAAMLSTVGAKDLEDLFSHLPADCRRDRPMELPEAMTLIDEDLRALFRC